MTSFRTSLKPHQRAAGRFALQVRQSLIEALAEEQRTRRINQSTLAKALGVNRSVIHRELKGDSNLTLRRVAELASLMNRKAVLHLERMTIPAGSNQAKTSTNGAKRLEWSRA